MSYVTINKSMVTAARGLTLLSLFSLVVTVYVAAQPGAGTRNITTVDRAGGAYTSLPR
jgi:hypothetical protein